MGSDTRGFVSKPIDEYPSIELHYAVFCGFSGLAKHLIITHGLDVNAKADEDRTPLHVASRLGHADVAQVLLEYEADINAQDSFKWAPLHSAATEGHPKVVQLLLERGAALDKQTGYMDTPLSLASYW
jgi:ankyrin repeat protein